MANKDEIKNQAIADDELKEVAGGRAYNEEWVCPKCGYVIYLTHYNANFAVSDHLHTHGWIGYGIDYGEDESKQ